MAEKKHQRLPISWARVLSSSEEIRYHLSSQSGRITGNTSASHALEAWSTLLNIPGNQSSVKEGLEPSLAALKQYPIISQIWRSQQQVGSSLQYTTQWLRQQSLSSQCHKTQAPPEKIRFITNVFRLFFIQKIQPLASRINGLHYQISPIIDQINTTAEFPEALAQQIHQYHQGFSRYQTHIREHVQYWQQLFRDCSISFTSR